MLSRTYSLIIHQTNYLELSNRLVDWLLWLCSTTGHSHITLNNLEDILMSSDRLAVRDYHSHKRLFWSTFRLYQIVWLHMLGITTLIVSLLGMIDTIKYFLGY